MIVATRVWRLFSIIFFIVFLHNSYVHCMVWDNRYFPWFDQMFTGADSRHAHFDLDVFGIVDRDAFRYEHRAQRADQVVSVPELWGQLKLDAVGKALSMMGKQNPIPEDWQWFDGFNALMPSSMDGVGMLVSAYSPLGKHCAIGGNTFILSLNSFTSITPAADSIEKLQLNTPSNMSLFTTMMHQMYKELGITGTSWQEVGVGDTVLYVSVHDTKEYKYKFRKIDWGCLAGMIIPTATTRNWNNIASVPFGGGDGMWGFFLAPFAELELKEDWFFGFQLRLTQRIDRSFYGRIPLVKEQLLLAPLMGDVSIDPGLTISFAPYASFQDIQGGFGIQAKYTLSVHENDRFTANTSSSGLFAKFVNANFYSAWTQEYATIKLFYDVAHDKNWKKRPFCYLAWDIPMNHIAGRGFAKTNRISLGCNLNF